MDMKDFFIQFDAKDPKVKKILDELYKNHYMKSFQGFLKDFKLNEGLKGEFTVDDLVEVHGHQSSIKFHGETGTIIHLGTNNALVRFDTRFNDNLHSGDGRDPSSCSYYIKYELLTLVNKDPDIRRIRFSFELKEVLDTIKDDVYAKLLIALIRGVNKSILVADPVDFLNFETDGTISCLKSRYFEEAKGKEWESPRRTKVRANRILRDIYNPVTNRVAKSLIDYPLTNIFEIGRFIIIDIICPGVAKEQLTLTVERLEEKVFLRVKGIPWYGMKNSDLKGKKPERSDIEIGDAFDKRYDITPYNIDLNAITSEYKDGVLTVSLCKKPDEDRGKQQFTINIK